MSSEEVTLAPAAQNQPAQPHTRDPGPFPGLGSAHPFSPWAATGLPQFWPGSLAPGEPLLSLPGQHLRPPLTTQRGCLERRCPNFGGALPGPLSTAPLAPDSGVEALSGPSLHCPLALSGPDQSGQMPCWPTAHPVGTSLYQPLTLLSSWWMNTAPA